MPYSFPGAGGATTFAPTGLWQEAKDDVRIGGGVERSTHSGSLPERWGNTSQTPGSSMFESDPGAESRKPLPVPSRHPPAAMKAGATSDSQPVTLNFESVSITISIPAPVYSTIDVPAEVASKDPIEATLNAAPGELPSTGKGASPGAFVTVSFPGEPQISGITPMVQLSRESLLFSCCLSF